MKISISTKSEQYLEYGGSMIVVITIGSER